MRNAKLRELFVEHHVENLPDVTDKPDIPPKSIRFWMMKDDGTLKKNKRFPAPHSVLKGVRGKPMNGAMDFTISQNKWCASFKDEDGVTINLVDECIVTAWLSYICEMVRIRKPYCTSTFTFVHLYVSDGCLYVINDAPLRQPQ